MNLSLKLKVLRTILPFLVGSLVGCTTIDKQVEGFPQDLEVKEHVVEPGEIWNICPGNLLVLPLACAWIELDKHTCDIYITPTSPPDTVEHERQHCKGGDHGGILQKYFDEWKEKNK